MVAERRQNDRRSGLDRRRFDATILAPDLRRIADRRSGDDRRKTRLFISACSKCNRLIPMNTGHYRMWASFYCIDCYEQDPSILWRNESHANKCISRNNACIFI